MKVDCEVILDILPSYAEEMTSDTTVEIVEEHLKWCPACRKRLEKIKEEQKVPQAFCDDSAKRLQRRNRQQRFKALLPLLTALSMLLTMVFGILVYCTVPVWITAEEADIVTEESVSNMIRVIAKGEYHGRVTVVPSTEYTDLQTTAWGICYYRYRNDWLVKQVDQSPYIAFEGQTLWYRGDLAGEEDSLILGDAGNTLDDIIAVEKAYGIYGFGNRWMICLFYGSLLIGAVCMILWWVFRKGKFGGYFRNVGILLLCCAAACWFVTDGRMLCTDRIYSQMGLFRRFAAVAVMTLFSGASIFCVLHLIRIKK